MADYDSSLPIRTENPGDAIVKIADATLPSQQLAVNADGSINITDNGGSLTVDATNLDIRDLSASQDNVAISDGTDTLAVNADGSINSVVSATDLDIRDLSSAQDSVSVLQATHDNLNGNMTIQVGDVDVSNANPVPVSDAGGSLTVDAVNLDIRDLSHSQDSVKVGDGTDFLAINNDGSINATVSATDLDIRDLSASQDNVAISDGTDTLAVNADGSINVVVSSSSGTAVNDYSTAAALASGGTSNHNYTVTAGKTLHLNQIEASGSGKMKIEVQVETGVATNTFVTHFVQFNSTSTPNMSVHLDDEILVAAGVRVRVIRTNRDNQAQDVYSTICGFEV